MRTRDQPCCSTQRPRMRTLRSLEGCRTRTRRALHLITLGDDFAKQMVLIEVFLVLYVLNLDHLFITFVHNQLALCGAKMTRTLVSDANIIDGINHT